MPIRDLSPGGDIWINADLIGNAMLATLRQFGPVAAFRLEEEG
ncbi:MAG: hypothetical protein OXC91_12180 [Rhodobacteraceae bacterium]|nr:hypothetical protein [Paracoccaceae bacterium]